MSSTSYSTSSSNPVVPPEELVTQQILNSIANVAVNYANTLYNWGQNVFTGLSGDISGLMGKLGAAADTAMSGATQAAGEFTNAFIPDYNQLRTEAAQYANPARQARNAGMAESDQMQANQSAINDATQKLESMGIDTSGGRYAHDLLSAKTAGTAAAAGAGTASIRADEATALGLKKNALDYGIQMPGIAANFLNQANQANSVAGNLDIGKTNAGTALMSVPNAYLNTAINDRYPPIGNNSRSQSNSFSTRPPSNSNSGSGNGNGGGNPGPLGPTSPFNDFNNNHAINPAIRSVDGSGGGFGGAGNNIRSYDGSSGSEYDPFSQPIGNYGMDTFNPAPTEGQIYGDYYNAADYPTMGSYPQGDTLDPNASYYGDYYPSDSSYSSYGNNVNPSYQDAGVGQGGDYGFDPSADFATGGAIPDPNATQGGFVPQEASPSMGQQTDDVHASLNANEFVVPKDVALWKGQEFFQKLIAQSRKNLAQAGAKGKPAPAPQGPVRFASRPMGR